VRPRLHLAEPDPPAFVHEGAAQPTDNCHLHLDALFRRHQGWLLALLRLRYGRDLAEDLLQETFLKAAQQNPDPPPRHPKAWLITIARNAARDRHRQGLVRNHLQGGDAAFHLERGGSAAHQDEDLTLKQVVLKLPPHLRDVCVLSRFAGLTYPEIAERLGIAVKTVEWRMTKALAAITRQLKG
jgi:RNA polymerase sigma-70 factor (ECF subfamily)